jgi:hypothetical protein
MKQFNKGWCKVNETKTAEQVPFAVQKTYNFVSDSGHGWLEVPARELAYYGLVSKISSYSYVSKDGKVWLEEDSDAGTFLKARFADTYPIVNSLIKEKNVNGDCYIRELPYYTLERVARWL